MAINVLENRRRMIAAQPHKETESGDIVSFSADSMMSLAGFKATINPVQDLHGYDSPWPAGGGKNILPYPFYDTTKTVKGVTFTDNGDGSITINGTATATAAFILWPKVDFPAGQTVAMASFHTGSKSGVVGIYDRVARLSDNGSGAVATYPDGYTRDIRIDVNTGATCNNYTLWPMLVIGSTIPTSYKPYSNICPISGWDAVKVTRTGKNMINPSELVYPANGSNVWYGIHLPPDTDFVFSTDSIITGLYVAYSDDDEMPSISAPVWTEITHKYNTTSLRFNSGSHKWYRLMTYEINGVIRDRLYQLELGTTATDYEPYQGETYDITLPTEAGTVYGGKLDVTSGVLTVDRAMVDLGTLNWSYMQNQGVFYSTTEIPAKESEVICSCYIYSKISVGNRPDKSINVCLPYFGENKVSVKDTAYSDAAIFKAAMSGVQLVYELATPIIYTLTPQEITTLIGINNVWADTGDITVTRWTH